MTRSIFALHDPNIRDHLIGLRDSALSDGMVRRQRSKAYLSFKAHTMVRTLGNAFARVHFAHARKRVMPCVIEPSSESPLPW